MQRAGKEIITKYKCGNIDQLLVKQLKSQNAKILKDKLKEIEKKNFAHHLVIKLHSTQHPVLSNILIFGSSKTYPDTFVPLLKSDKGTVLNIDEIFEYAKLATDQFTWDLNDSKVYGHRKEHD